MRCGKTSWLPCTFVFHLLTHHDMNSFCIPFMSNRKAHPRLAAAPLHAFALSDTTKLTGQSAMSESAVTVGVRRAGTGIVFLCRSEWIAMPTLLCRAFDVAGTALLCLWTTQRWCRFCALLVMLPWFALPVGCMRGPEQKGKPDHIPEVEVSVPLQDLVTDSEEFTGRIVAVDTITVRARATGYLDRVNFREGVEVNKGDVLFEIDPRTYKADYERAMANLVQAEARLKRVEADYHRARTSFSRGAVSSEDLDHALYDRNEADAAVGVARASRDSAQLNLDFTKVIAPVSGRISRRLVDPGNLIKADDTPLTTIVSQDPIYVYFHVDERTTLRIRRLILEGKVKSARVAAMPVNEIGRASCRERV